MLQKDLPIPEWHQPRNEKICKIKVGQDLRSNHFDLMRAILVHPEMNKYAQDVGLAFQKYSSKLVREIFRRFFGSVSDTRKKAILMILEQRHKIGISILAERAKK